MENTDKKIKEIMDRRLTELTWRYPALGPVRDSIGEAYLAIKESYDRGGKLMVAGNGGSCADALHIVGELMKGFCKKRPLPEELKDAIISFDGEDGAEIADRLQMGLMAIALSEHQSLNTAYANDVDPGLMFAQQLMGYSRKGDSLLLISTSGNSKDLIAMIPVAKALGVKVIGLTGKDGGRISREADVSIVAPGEETYKIQELHLPIYHTLCLMLEDTYFEV